VTLLDVATHELTTAEAVAKVESVILHSAPVAKVAAPKV